MKEEKRVVRNPIILSDYPDVDVIRVDDAFYMVSTTMHFMPGCVILRSYNLADWEIASYVFNTLENTPGQKLADKKGIYGKGMWAASLRYHKGTFYICFVANDTGKTYIYQSKKIEGPWKMHVLEGFYHDNSILFDKDGRVYIMYGNREIHVTELEPDLSGIKKDGLDKVVLTDSEDYGLGFEGTHFYQINGKYYAFFIHWAKGGTMRRMEACYVAERPEGPYRGGNVLDDDMGFRNAGVAQGGIVDTPEGDWYAMLFQDYGALGRIPVLVPVTWNGDFPVFGENGRVPHEMLVRDYRPEHRYQPLYESDDFDYTAASDGSVALKKVWQWNHEPDARGWSVTERPGYLRLKTLDTRVNVVQAVNTLTQRTYGIHCSGIIKLDGTGMKSGDYAGISAFMGNYCFLALTKEDGRYALVQLRRSVPESAQASFMGGMDAAPGIECARAVVDSAEVTLKVECCFGGEQDYAVCYYEHQGSFVRLGEKIALSFTLDHFTGCRFALSYFATKEAGGVADFDSFTFESDEI